MRSCKRDKEEIIKELEDRLQKLAMAKSHYQMVSEILTSIAEANGLEELMTSAIFMIMNALGGTNVEIYYKLGEQWFMADVSRSPEIIDPIADRQILRVIETGEVIEDDGESGQINVDNTDYEKQPKNIIYPLKWKDTLYGVIRITGIIIQHDILIREELKSIITYLNLALKNELNSSHLMLEAYEDIKSKSRELEKEIEEKTKEQAKFYKTINSSFDGFWITDSKGIIKDVNEEYCHLTGYERSELIDSPVSLVEHLEGQPDVEQHIKMIIDTGRGRFESVHKCKNGELLDVEVNSNYSRDEELFYVFIKDIRYQKQLEKEKEELMQFQNQTSKMESIGRLAGGVAHDLNNLLTPVLAYGEMLSRNLMEGDKRKKAADMILKAGLSARDIVHQLLAFSRKQELDYRNIDLNDVIGEFRSILSRTIREDVELIFEIGAVPLPINADISQIEQVLMNLIVNAQDSIEGQKGIVRIQSELIELETKSGPRLNYLDAGAYALLTISDNGCGMDEATQKQIFEPFYSTKGEKGTGLGLSTVIGIIEQHKGTISVKSRLGEGTEFSIYIPIGSSQSKSSEDQRDIAKSLDMKSTKLLVVEDSPDLRETTVELLEEQGFQVVAAGDGEEALQLLKSDDTIHILLTDVIMPVMNGSELFKAARELHPTIKVLFMSGYTYETLEDVKIDEKNSMFIKKPYTISLLCEKILELASS